MIPEHEKRAGSQSEEKGKKYGLTKEKRDRMGVFPEKYHCESIKYRMWKREKTDEILKQYPQDTLLSKMETDDLYALLNESEREQFALRAALEEQEWAAERSPSCPAGDLSMSDFPVSISFDGTSITVKTPPTLNRKAPKKEFKPDDFLLAEYVKVAFAKWKTDHPETDFRTLKSFHGDEKLLLIITRKALRYNRDRHVDNDNFECQRVQNAICSALFVSNSCKILSLINHFEVVDNESECGVEFKIGPAKYLAKEFAEKDFRVPPTSKLKARKGII